MRKISPQQETCLENIAAYTSDIVVKEFIKNLYSDVPHAELSSINPEYLCKSTISTFKLLKKRNQDEHKVNIYRPGKEYEHAVIEIINADVPFLVDSIGNKLKAQNCEIHLIVHPALEIQRDTQGNSKDSGTLMPKRQYYSFIFQIYVMKYTMKQYTQKYWKLSNV